MKSCKEISALWGISERRVTQFCKDGKIPGAVRAGKQWQIPDDAKRPSDSRIVTGQYVKTETEEGKKPLLVGTSDYIRTKSEYNYVYKTCVITKIMSRKSFVSLCQ